MNMFRRLEAGALFSEPVSGVGVNDGECDGGYKKEHGHGKKYGAFQNGADDAEQHAEGQEKHQLAGEAAQGAFIVPFFFLPAQCGVAGDQEGAFSHGKDDSEEDENSHEQNGYQKGGKLGGHINEKNADGNPSRQGYYCGK